MAMASALLATMDELPHGRGGRCAFGTLPFQNQAIMKGGNLWRRHATSCRKAPHHVVVSGHSGAQERRKIHLSLLFTYENSMYCTLLYNTS